MFKTLFDNISSDDWYKSPSLVWMLARRCLSCGWKLENSEKTYMAEQIITLP